MFAMRPFGCLLMSVSRLESELYVALFGDEVLTDVECISSEPSLDWLPRRRPASTCSLAPSVGWENCFWGRGRPSKALPTEDRHRYCHNFKKPEEQCHNLSYPEIFTHLTLLQYGWVDAEVQGCWEIWAFSPSLRLPFQSWCFSVFFQSKQPSVM